jgi:hypothetical protein
MWLEVSKSELSDVLDLLPDISPLLAAGQAQLFFDGVQLTAKGLFSSFEVNATGEWWQVGLVSMHFFYGLRGRLPEAEKIRIRADKDKIWFNNTSITASFQSGIYEDYPFTLEAKMIDVLKARKHLTEEQLKRSGLAPMVLAVLNEVQNIADETWDEIAPEIEKIGISKREFWSAFLNGVN